MFGCPGPLRPDAGAPDDSDGGLGDAGAERLDAGTPDDSDGGPPSDAGSPVDAGSFADRFSAGRLTPWFTPRPQGFGLHVVRRGAQTWTLELDRDARGQVRRRLVARTARPFVWQEPDGERLHHFAVHPSGAVTLGLERLDAGTDAYSLVRLDETGGLRFRQPVQAPRLRPADEQLGARADAFALKGVASGSVITGWLPWLRPEADGEDVVLGLLSMLRFEDGGVSGSEALSAVVALELGDGGYVERWSRLVDAPHALIAVAWQYDEFLWLDAATRLLVSVDADGAAVVGRTVSNSRCTSLVAFGETSTQRCRQLRAVNSPHRFQPFAFTRFEADGGRSGSAVLAPTDVEEFVVFDLAVRWPLVGLVGTAVRLGDGGTPEYYFEPPGQTGGTPLSPYDAWLAIVEGLPGLVRHEAFVDLGRGELLASAKWTESGLLAAGATDWNRWWGGMSLSRSAEPLLVLHRLDAGVRSRTLPVEGVERHTHLLSIDVGDGGFTAVGPHDAPMTHSGDVEGPPAMTLGGARLELTD